jgi:hypothetical protein
MDEDKNFHVALSNILLATAKAPSVSSFDAA